MSDVDGPLLGTPSLILLAVLAILTFATVARWVRAPRTLVLAAVAASVVFAAHNASVGREMYGDYWGTFPGDRLTSPELLVLYVTQALVFVGGSGTFMTRVSRKAPWWLVPFVWLGGGLLVMLTVLFASHALAAIFHWPWVVLQHKDASEFWGGRLAMAYVFIGIIGRERKATAEVKTMPVVEKAADAAQPGDAEPSATRSVGKPSSEGRPWGQTLLFAPVVFALLAVMGTTFSRAAEHADQAKVEHEAARLDFARRLRADGDRLASEGRWGDALARYDQAEPYDHVGESESETKQKRLAMEAHVGKVVLDKEFEDRGAQR